MNRPEHNELVEIDDCVCSIATAKQSSPVGGRRRIASTDKRRRQDIRERLA
jgi:hypothetical protein